MAYNVSAAIAEMRLGIGSTIYSMNYRQNDLPRMRDCSSAISEALLAGGVNIYYANGSAPNTVGMLRMVGTHFDEITEEEAHAGDICVMGGNGGNGAAGHVFMLTSDNTEIECTPSGVNMAGVEGTANAINETDYGYLKELGWQMDWLRPISDDESEGKEVVFSKNGVWYTDEAFTKKANGILEHMGAYWSFDNGRLRKSEFTAQWGKVYWSGSDGKIVQGSGSYKGMKFDFGTDNTYFVKSITVADPNEFLNTLK